MNVKKTFAGCLILIAVLALAIVSAGCVNQPSGDEQGIDVPDVAVLVSVEKTGTTYNIGDTMEVILTEVEGTKFYVKDHDDGISIDKKEVSVKHGDKELTGVKFTITALKDGVHHFSIGVDVHGVGAEGLDDVFYEDTMHVVKTGDEPMTPRGVFTLIALTNSAPGEYYDISVRGNATTGYKWVAGENKDLIVSEPVYIPDEADGKFGVGGTFHWYVTAEKPGDYVFTAYEMPPAGKEPTGSIEVPISFANDPKAADVPEAVASIAVKKAGITYSIGDTMEVNLVNFPTAFPFYVKDHDEGISVEKKESSVKLGDKDASCVTFTITALKNGNHTFSIGVDFHGVKIEGRDDVVYEDTVHVVDTGAEPMTPRGVFTLIEGQAPYSGDYIDISVRGNATTGYHWVAAENKDLIVSDPVYISDEAPEGMVGVGGTYHWYVTADKPGEYEFTTYEMPPAGDEPTGRVIVPVAFMKKAD